MKGEVPDNNKVKPSFVNCATKQKEVLMLIAKVFRPILITIIFIITYLPITINPEILGNY